jgi:ABC-type sulfate transport system permease component
MLSSAGRLSRWPLLKVVSLAAVVSLTLEFAQALPRPGVLRHLNYTFDWYDVAATVVSILLAYLVAWLAVRAHTRRVSGA